MSTFDSHQLQKIVVTGAARGLGFAFAKAILDQGCSVVLTDIHAANVPEAAQAVALCAASNERAHYMQLDVRDRDPCIAVMEKANEVMGAITGLVNNAAITNSGGKAMQDIKSNTWDEVMAVNVRGVWNCTVAARPHLIRASEERGLGRIVNVASDTALWGAPNLMAYVASKGAVIAMTHAMARELGAYGITVNAIAPGLTLGESTEYVPKARHEHYKSGRAIKREQTADDITAIVMFLLSAESGYITGQVLPVNGGFVMK